MAHRVRFEEQGRAIVANLEGRVHGSYVDEVDTALSHSVLEKRFLVLELSKLDFISSSGLRTFLKLRRDLISRGGAVAIASPTENVRKILDVASFEHLFLIVDSVDDAIKEWGLETD